MATGHKRLRLVVIIAVLMPLLTCWSTEYCYLSLCGKEEITLVSSITPYGNTLDDSCSPEECSCVSCQTFFVNAFITTLPFHYDFQGIMTPVKETYQLYYISEIFHPPLA